MKRTVMNWLVSLVFLAGFCGCGFLGMRSSEVHSEAVWGIAEGKGSNQQEAVQDGLKLLIEQWLGVFIQSETKVEKSRLIEQEILAYSRGYVERYEILDEQSDPNGITQVTVYGRVRKEALQHRLKSLGILKVEGAREAINASLAFERRNTAMRLAHVALDRSFRKHWEVTVGAFTPHPLPHGEIKVEFDVQVDGSSDEWRGALRPLVETRESSSEESHQAVGLSPCLIAMAVLDRIDRFTDPLPVELQRWVSKPFEGFPVRLPTEVVEVIKNEVKGARMRVQIKNRDRRVIAEGLWSLATPGDEWRQDSLMALVSQREGIQITLGGLDRPVRFRVSGLCRLEDLREIEGIEAKILTAKEAEGSRLTPRYQIVFNRQN